MHLGKTEHGLAHTKQMLYSTSRLYKCILLPVAAIKELSVQHPTVLENIKQVYLNYFLECIQLSSEATIQTSKTPGVNPPGCVFICAHEPGLQDWLQ